MCVVSMVYDHFDKIIPPVWEPLQPLPLQPTPGAFSIPNFQIISQEEVDNIRKLIGEFKQAVEAAKTVDRLTNQPDCEDPVKKKLEDRVAALEAQVAELLQMAQKTEKDK